eukprot:gene15665-19145_t
MLLTELLGIDIPLIQAPMVGVSTPKLAAAVSNAGALGSIGIGASTPEQARTMIRDTRALTAKPFNVNLFWVRDCADEVALLHERVLPGGGVYLFYEVPRPEEVPRVVEQASAALSNGGFRVSVVDNKRPAVIGII